MNGARRGHALACAAIVLVSAALYGRTLGYGFVQYDDHELLVRQHAAVSALADPRAAFSRDAFAVLGRPARGVYYRPLLVQGYGIEARLAGPSPRLHHTTNLALHGLASCLAYALFVAFGCARALAAGLALLYGCHPASALLAAWIPARNDSMLAIACLAATLALLAFLRRGRPAALVLCLLATVAALFTKESGVALLAVLGCVIAVEGPVARERRRALWVATAAAIAATGAWAALRHAALGGSPVGASRIGENLAGLLVYVGKTVLPTGLALVPDPADSALWPGIVAAAGFALAIAATGRRLRGPAGLGLVWYTAFLLPALLVHRGTWGLEHRIAVPLLGALLFASQLRLPARVGAPRWLGAGLAFAAAALFALVTHGRLPAFAGPVAYWERAAREAPHSRLAASRLAWRYFEAERLDDALSAAARALALDPEQAEMFLLRGVALARQGELRSAASALERAVALAPESGDAWAHLARVQRLRGREEEGRRAEREAERIRERRSR